MRSGLKIVITDERTSTGVCSPAPPPQPPAGSGAPPAPQCVPPSGVRYELTFGSITAQQSVNAFAGVSPDAAGGAAAVTPDVGGTDFNANPSVPADVPSPDLGAGTGAPTELNQTPFTPPRSNIGSGSTSPNFRNAAGGFKLAGANLAQIAALTAAAAAGLGLCVWFLLGVVNSVANGTPLKLPGL